MLPPASNRLYGIKKGYNMNNELQNQPKQVELGVEDDVSVGRRDCLAAISHKNTWHKPIGV